MTTHHLKVQAEYWDAIRSGDKNFEVRINDRGFQKGDLLVLHRLLGVNSGLPPLVDSCVAAIHRTISYILTGGQFGIEPRYVVMGLKEVSE